MARLVALFGGYAGGWKWTGFPGLPGALAITTALAGRGLRSHGRLLRPYEKRMVIALVAGWIVTVIGGYALRWTWTGYHGNTLWDWLTNLLVATTSLGGSPEAGQMVTRR